MTDAKESSMFGVFSIALALFFPFQAFFIGLSGLLVRNLSKEVDAKNKKNLTLCLIGMGISALWFVFLCFIVYNNFPQIMEFVTDLLG